MHTFINYADNDEALVKRIYADLLAAGVRPWARVFDIGPGEDRENLEIEAVESASAVVAIFSQTYTRNEKLVEFAEAANALGAVVVPVIVDSGVKVPDHLPTPIKMTRQYAKALEEIVKLIPHSEEPLAEIPAWQRGNAAYAGGDYEAAVEAYTSITDPTPTMLNSRAAAYNALRQHDKALVEVDAAIAAEPDKAPYYRNRSLAYAGLNQHDKALADDEKALEFDPDSLESLSSYAMTLVALKRFDDAKAALEKVIAKAPDNILYRYQLGFAMSRSEDWEAALAAFDQALELDPDNESATIGRRVVLGRLGRHEEALSEIDRAIQKQPRKVGNYLTRSLVNFYLERYDDAVNDASVALRGKQKDAYLPAFFNRAIAYWRMGDKEQAQADFLEAIELMPDLKTEVGIHRNAESEQTSDAALEILESLKADERLK